MRYFLLGTRYFLLGTRFLVEELRLADLDVCLLSRVRCGNGGETKGAKTTHRRLCNRGISQHGKPCPLVLGGTGWYWVVLGDTGGTGGTHWILLGNTENTGN